MMVPPVAAEMNFRKYALAVDPPNPAVKGTVTVFPSAKSPVVTSVASWIWAVCLSVGEDFQV